MKKRWSIQENGIMKQNYGKIPNLALSGRLGRSVKAIVCHAGYLGISYYPEMPKFLSNEERQVILGSLFGDGHCRPLKNRNLACLQFCCNYNDLPYLRWKHSILSNFCGKAKLLPYTDKRGNSITVQFNTRYSALFKEFLDAFYHNGKKKCEDTKLRELDALGLAVWYMDDGSVNKNSARIATSGFSVEENYLISDYFEGQWGIKAKVQFSVNHRTNHTYPYLEFNKQEAEELLSIVHPYIIPCMSRKVKKS